MTWLGGRCAAPGCSSWAAGSGCPASRPRSPEGACWPRTGRPTRCGPPATTPSRNSVELETALVDWAHPEPIVERAPWRYVIASDVLYERRNVAQLLELLPLLVDEKGEVLIADPQRAPAEGFLERAEERWHVRTTGSSRSQRTRIHHLRRR